MKRLTLVLAFSLSIFPIARAAAEFEAQSQSQLNIPLPPGSYIETCEQCTFQDRTLMCSCKDRHGSPQNTFLSRPYLCSSIDNIDGHLQCQSRMQPQSYTHDVNAGPIWNQADAQNKCPSTCNAVKGQWNGQWRTIDFNNSVCGCTWSR